MYIKFQFWGSGALYLSFVPIKGINKTLFILSRLNDFMTCSVHLMFRVKGPYLSFGTLYEDKV